MRCGAEIHPRRCGSELEERTEVAPRSVVVLAINEPREFGRWVIAQATTGERREGEVEAVPFGGAAVVQGVEQQLGQWEDVSDFGEVGEQIGEAEQKRFG